jgi:hypothetical protein
VTSKIRTLVRRGLLVLALVSFSLSAGASAEAGQAGDARAASEAAAAQPLNPCSPGGATKNPCNPCGGSENPCNPCGAGANACNPCGGDNPCNPCGGAKIDPARFKQPAGFQVGGDRSELLAEGERLWNDRSLGSSGIACSTCHTDDYGQMRSSFGTPYPHRVEMPHQRAGVAEVTAAEMVNFCMLVPMNDEPLAWSSSELAALTTYVENIQAAYPVAAANPCNPCGAQPSSRNPCNPCGAESNPCNPCNPCGAESNPCNPCNPCGAESNPRNPCNPCGGAES